MRCVEDNEIQAAIEELEKSTASIEKQTKALLTQQESIASFMKENTHNLEDRARVNKTQNKAWMTESADVATAVRVIGRETESFG